MRYRGFAVAGAIALLAPALVAAQGTAAGSARDARRAGWVGLALLARGEGDAAGRMSMDYPVVASVEPNSPAQEAGFTAGDTILSFNGVDARNTLELGRFLRPGTRIRFAVRRNGAREISLRVIRRPRGVDEPRVRMTLQAGEPIPPLAPLAAALGPLALARPLVPTRGMPLAGAQLARINAGLAEVLRMHGSGVLVVDVAPGTPATRSGLEPGDVILRANSLAVASPEGVLRAMQAARDRSVALEILRRGRTERLILRW